MYFRPVVIYHDIFISSSLKIACFICNHIVYANYVVSKCVVGAGGDHIMPAPGLNKSNAASLPHRTKTSYLEPNAVQIEAFQRNYLLKQRRAFSSRLSNQV